MLASLIWPWDGRVGCWGVVGCLQRVPPTQDPPSPKLPLKNAYRYAGMHATYARISCVITPPNPRITQPLPVPKKEWQQVGGGF
eukprot:1161868-Pelagomonas_calceolata.AAC.16